jgi:hypothetical protein
MLISGIFCLVAMIVLILLAIYFYFGVTKDARNYGKYINSIRVGDVFKINNASTLVENPFEREFEYTFTKCIITDIKESDNGDKWVKYKCMKSGAESSCKLVSFIEDYTRIEIK